MAFDQGAFDSDLVPQGLRLGLKESWKCVGEKLTAYRDAVAHYDPLTTGTTTVWTRRIRGRWGATVRLPSEPRIEEQSAFILF